MVVIDLLDILRECPLIASVQASEGSPVDDPQTLLRLAQASLREGVKVLRLQGVENIQTIKAATQAPVIGLIKKDYPGSEVYITPTREEVKALLATGCEVIALDGTSRTRPDGSTLKELVELIHKGGAIAMADCDTVETAEAALDANVDILSSTLAGYTSASVMTEGPDLEMVRRIATLGRSAIAEGRYSQPWQVRSALRMGAAGVVVGGALNDPVKQTRTLKPKMPTGEVLAFDIGGTWLRFGSFTKDWVPLVVDRALNPPTREERLEWMQTRIDVYRPTAVGVGTGGIVDPSTGLCWAAKEYLMPDQIGIEFNERTFGVPTYAHGDGHATAWGHACHRRFTGRRVATLALGTGVGCGFVENGRIWAGHRGEYPRINDLPTSSGKTFEDLLGGINLTIEPTEEQKMHAIEALEDAVFAIRNLYFPDDIVIAGSVGFSPWMSVHLDRLGLIPSPFKHEAGLYGAAALALYPPT